MENKPIRKATLRKELQKAFLVDSVDIFIKHLEDNLDARGWSIGMIFFAKAMPKGTKKIPFPHIFLKIETDYDNYLHFRMKVDGTTLGYGKAIRPFLPPHQ